jgi:hypothetical protein
MTHQQLFEMKMELVRKQVEYFITHELFTWQWWLLIAMTIVPWFFWYQFRNIECQRRLLFGGLFVGLVSLIADMIGTQAGIWRYGIKAIPSLPPLIPFDLAIMPVEYMVIQQIAKNQKQFLLIALGVAAANAFIAEPILKWIDVYKPHDWQRIYSFPLYFLIFWFTSKLVTNKTGWKDIY